MESDTRIRIGSRSGGLVGALLAVLWSAGCGGASAGTPAAASGPQSVDPPIVTLTSAGASPRELHIFARDVATFVNRDARPHEVVADPARNDDARCRTAFVGLLAPGESRRAELQPSGVPCFYRDERDPGNGAFQGYVLTHY